MIVYPSKNIFLAPLSNLKKFLLRSIIIFLCLVFPLNSEAQFESPSFSGQDNYEKIESINYGELFMQGEHLFHAGDFFAAKSFFHRYLEENERGERRLKAFFRLGLIDQSEKSYFTALRFYKIILDSSPDYLLANEIKFNMAICNFEIGNLETARALFESVFIKSVDKKEKWKALYYLSRLDELKLDFDSAIVKLKAIYFQVNDKEINQKAFELIKRMIDVSLNDKAISLLLQKHNKGFPADLLFLKKLSNHRENGEIEKYKSVLEKFLYEFPEHKESELLKNDLEAIKKTDSPVEVGIVLPLTGKLAATGQKVLQGIQLAYNLLPEPSRNHIFLNVKDSSGSSDIESVLSELARNPKTVAVIGPLLSDEIRKSIKVADLFKLNIFSPTASSAGIVETSSYIFRNALTRKIQAQFLAEYSINTLNLRRFVILYPMEPFGEELKDEFLKAVEGFGGEIIGVSSYDRSQNDFKKQILELGGIADDDLYRITRKQIIENKVINDFSDSALLSRPKVEMEHWSGDKIENLKVSLELGYDALFIPGIYDKVGLIIPQLAFYNIEKISLLGTNGWNSPELIKMGGKFLKSIYFVDGFYTDSKQIRVRRFVEQFKNNYGEIPSNFSAHAYDAAGIIFKSINSGASNRLELRESLIKVKNYPGVTGKTSLLESGDSEKNIFALTVRKKKIVEEN